MRRCKLQGVVAAQTGDDPRYHLARFGDKDLEPMVLRLHVARRCSGMSVSLMAAALGVARSTVWRWENGEIHTMSERVLKEWAYLTDYSVEWLIHGGRAGDWVADDMCIRLAHYFKKLVKPLPDKEAARLGIATTWKQSRERVQERKEGADDNDTPRS